MSARPVAKRPRAYSAERRALPSPSALRGARRARHDGPVNARAISLLALVLSIGCGPSAVTSDAGLDAARSDAGCAAFWPRTLPPTSELGPRRGRSIARAIVHLHSPLSHDACAGNGWADGGLAAPECLAHLRASACALNLDAAMLTDHAPHVEEVSLEGALWLQDGDERVRDTDGSVIAGRWICDDGHRVLVTMGSENTLMPIMLDRHPADPSDPDALRAVYDEDGADAVTTFQAAGALVWQAHTEQRPLDDLRALGVDGLEIYNLHANVGPDIRETYLGLEPFGYVAALLDFTSTRYRMPPDLAVLAFLSENQPSLDKWDALLSEGVHVTGSGGCDAHENTLPMTLTDGERADSYRRMMLWVQNHLLVDDDSPESMQDALARGRSYVTFEVFGSPIGFDFVGESGGATFEMGEDAPAGTTLRVTRPSLPAGFPSDPPPVIHARILRSTAEGAVEVASGDGDTLELVTTEPGAYRAEVLMVPEHARPALGVKADSLIREVVWVYSNPIFVEP